jgi:tetratricopeptide (TPR) repeat protein
MSGEGLQRSRYSPGNLAPAVLERLFVGRSELLDELIDKVSKSILSRSKHHLLLVGPRGSGKTHLIALLHQRLTADPDLAGARKKSVIAYLNEEEWGVASFLDFLLVILRSLESQHAEVADRIALVEETFERDLDKALTLAEDALLQVIEGKTLVLLCENLSDLFEGLGFEGQARWRALVQEHHSWCIIATAPSLFLAVSRQTQPFYGFFTIRSLEALSLNDAIELLRRKAELENRSDLATAIDTPIGRARVRAIHHIAGGNHRAYIVLSEFVAKGSLDELVTPFMQMVDDLTPYYQERMRNLTSPLQRKLVDYLCRQRRPSTVKEIARATLVQPQSAAKQLGELAKSGLVQRTPRGRESFYELSEPLMRICIEVKDNRTDYINTFVELLRHWFSSRELESRHRDSSSRPGSLEHIHLRAALEDYRASKTDPFLDALKLEMSADELGRLRDDMDAIKASWELADVEAVERRARDALARHPEEDAFRLDLTAALLVQQKYEATVEQCDEIIRRDPRAVKARRVRAVALYHLKRYAEAVADQDGLLGPDTDPDYGHEIHARALFKLGRYADAASTLAELVGRRPSFFAYLLLAACLYRMQRNEDGLRSCDTALGYDPDKPEALILRTGFLMRLERFEEMLENSRRISAIAPDYPLVYGNIAYALMRLQRWEEAFEASRILIAKLPDDANSWRLHLHLAMVQEDLQGAEEAFLQLKRLSNGGDHEIALMVVHLKGLQGRWRDAIEASEEAMNQQRTPDAIFAHVWAVLCAELDLSPEQESAVTEHAHAVSAVWLVEVLRALREVGHDELRAAVVSRTAARTGEDSDLLYEHALVWLDQGKLDDAAVAAGRLASSGADAQSSVVQRLVKIARLGLSTLLGEQPTLEVLAAGLWIELRQRGPSSLAQHCVTLRERLDQVDRDELLIEALFSVLRRLVDHRSMLDRSAEWTDALATMSSRMPGLEEPLHLFSVGVRYAATQDEGVLLELPLEQRKLLTSEISGAS